MLQLELLANELLVYIFEFFDTDHLVRAFFGLNARFNHLLYYHFRVHQLCFQSIVKNDFDIICQEYLPVVIDQITSLRLSNEKTSSLSELFLSHGFTLDQFLHLKSLSLHHIYSTDTMNQIIIQCRCLSNLHRLHINNCCVANVNNNIWNLPKLTHCTINDIAIKDAWLSKISVVSLSIEYLSINNIDGYSNILQHLFEITPRLQRLDINVCCWLGYDLGRIVFSSLVSLKTSFKGDVDAMIHLLRKMPNLCYLTLETWKICMDGNDWENLFVDYLPKMKIFRLRMNFDLPLNDNITNRIDQLVDSFRTVFWLEEHQWYVKCDYYDFNGYKTAMLYTSSYNFNELPLINPHYSKSTDPNNDQFLLDDRIEVPPLICLNLDNTYSHHLQVTLPLNRHTDRFYSSLNRSTSLHVTLTNSLDYRELQIMLDQAYHLYSLKFYSFGGSLLGLFQLTSSSIRQLNLLTTQDQYGQSFSSSDCFRLINSSLGRQCEVLFIQIDNGTTILDLIKEMSNLKVVTFRCPDSISFHKKDPIVNRKFVQWLQKNLPSTCSITIDLEDKSLIRIGINRQTMETRSFNDSSLIPRRKTRISSILSSIRQVFFQSH